MPNITTTKPVLDIRQRLTIKWRDRSWAPQIVIAFPAQSAVAAAPLNCAKRNRVVVNRVPVRRRVVNRARQSPRSAGGFALIPFSIPANLRARFSKPSR